MLPAFFLALREGVEVALILGIVMGSLRKIHRTDLGGTVWWGAGVAAVVSLVVAVILSLVGAEFEGPGEQLFEGTAMILAAGLLTWMIYWMARQSGALKAEIESSVSRAVLKRGRSALFILAFVAVVRDGIELALFLMAARLTSTPLEVYIGAGLGLAASAVLGWLLFASSRRLNIRLFFQITNVLLVLFAAGLVAHAMHEFIEASVFPALISQVYDLSHILPQESLLGTLLSTLFGYTAAPSLTEAVAYMAYFALLTFSLRFMSRPPATPLQEHHLSS